MGKALVDYLSGAIKGGQASNATLVYGGNPHQFPYEHNEGQFQVSVPLKNATFAFQPDWPALTGLDINLNFVNNGLWMKADKATLGNVTASNLDAVIPDYSMKNCLSMPMLTALVKRSALISNRPAEGYARLGAG